MFGIMEYNIMHAFECVWGNCEWSECVGCTVCYMDNKIPKLNKEMTNIPPTSKYSNHSAPSRQSSLRSLVKKLATFCLPLLDINPVALISLILASTNGTPVLPSFHASNISWF